MKRLIFSLIVLLAISTHAEAQRYLTKSGHIKFYSSTPVEDIEAHNRSVQMALDSQKGDVVFKVLMKSFSFEKALMQEHFNENYVESHKFPNSTFQGKVTDIQKVDFSAEGEYEVEVEGKLTIHGVANDIAEPGTITVNEEGIHAGAVFMIKPADYDIEIPAPVRKNIAREIEVTVDCSLKKQN
ncbi:MAG: YceI family protein [Bacteroidota bacterium]